MTANARFGEITADQLQRAARDLGDADVTVDLSNSHAGHVTNVTTDGTITAPTFDGDLTGNADTATNAGHATTADTASSISGVNLGDLADVDTTGAAADQVLGYNGTEWVPRTSQGGASGSGVIVFYQDDTDIVPSSSENAIEVTTLATSPITTTEVVDSIVVNNSTVTGEAYLYNTALGGTSIEAGIWEFYIWASASITAGTSEILSNIHRVISGGAYTVTITGGPGTSRTCTVSGGSHFVSGDASGTVGARGYVQTPKGLYPITAYSSATEVTIQVPAAYVNESTVAFSVWRRLFQVTTGDINSTGTNYTLYEIESAQSSFACNATDKIGWVVFGKTTHTSNVTISWTHNGTSHYSNVHTPLIRRHNDLVGLQGGSASERYHLTSAQATSVGSASAAYSALRYNALADAQLLTSAADTTVTLDGTYASDILVTGTAVMYVLNLGTATAYTNGKRFTIYNGTPEFVGVLNTDLSVWHRVPPRAKCHCILADNSTASGVWFSEVEYPKDLREGQYATDDFNGLIISNNYYGMIPLGGAVSSGVHAIYTTGDPVGTQGIVSQQVAAVASYCLFSRIEYVQPGAGGACRCIRLRASRSNANSSATNEFTSRLGWGNSTTGAAHTDGAYFLNDYTTYGNFWVTRTVAAAGGNTTNVSNIVPAVFPSWDNLGIEWASGGTRVDFFVNQTLLYTHSTAANIPGAGIIVLPKLQAVKVANTSARLLYHDYLAIGSFPTNLR